jgi:hypothetical protein
MCATAPKFQALSAAAIYIYYYKFKTKLEQD